VALIVETGDGSMSFTNILTLGSRGSMANQSPNAMTIRFNPNTGSFTGTVQQPGSGQSLRFGGAALQSENAGFGYFLGNHQAGSVLLLPAL